MGLQGGLELAFLHCYAAPAIGIPVKHGGVLVAYINCDFYTSSVPAPYTQSFFHLCGPAAFMPMQIPSSHPATPFPAWDDAFASTLDEPGLLLYRANLLGSDLRITN